MMKEVIAEAEAALLHTYNRYQIVLERGEGVYLYDLEGKKYLDFASGIGVFALGYHYGDFDDTLKGQIDKLLHTSNYYYNRPAMEAVWTGCFLPTAARKRWKVPLRQPESMRI